MLYYKKPIWTILNSKNLAESGLANFITHLVKCLFLLTSVNLLFQLHTSSNKEDRTVIIKGSLFAEENVITNIYAPSIHIEGYFAPVYNKITHLDCNNVILGGEFNWYLNPDMDKSPAVNIKPLKLLILLKLHIRSLVKIPLLRVTHYIPTLSNCFTYRLNILFKLDDKFSWEIYYRLDTSNYLHL